MRRTRRSERDGRELCRGEKAAQRRASGNRRKQRGGPSAGSRDGRRGEHADGRRWQRGEDEENAEGQMSNDWHKAEETQAEERGHEEMGEEVNWGGGRLSEESLPVLLCRRLTRTQPPLCLILPLLPLLPERAESSTISDTSLGECVIAALRKLSTGAGCCVAPDSYWTSAL